MWERNRRKWSDRIIPKKMPTVQNVHFDLARNRGNISASAAAAVAASTSAYTAEFHVYDCGCVLIEAVRRLFGLSILRSLMCCRWHIITITERIPVECCITYTGGQFQWTQMTFRVHNNHNFSDCLSVIIGYSIWFSTLNGNGTEQLIHCIFMMEHISGG